MMEIGLRSWILVVIALPMAAANLIPPIPPIPPMPTTAAPVLTTKPATTDVNTSATTAFAMHLYKGITKEAADSENIFISPLAVSLSLAMLNIGANNETSAQIEDVLFQKIGAVKNTDEFNAALGNLMKAMMRKNRNLIIANKMWQQKYFCFSQCRRFAKKLQQYYLSELGQVDFASDPEKARENINAWVGNQTNGKITELIPPAVLSTVTRFVLTNAIYFKSSWENPFVLEYTHNAWFNVVKGGKNTRKLVPTMYVKEHFRASYGAYKSYRVVELPYKGGEFSMLIIMPHDSNGFRELERSMTGRKLQGIAKEIHLHPPRSMEIFLPKFKISYGLQLNNVLKDLGVRDVFDPIRADLTKMSGFRGMYVSAVNHKSFVNVNEFGTEASGATGVVTDDFNLDFVRINRPFLFTILHDRTATVLFLGRVIDPTQ